MKLNKKYKRLMVMTVCFLALVTLPIYIQIYYTALYYAEALLLIPIAIYRIVWEEKLEKKFYHGWHKAREQGFWLNVVREGLRTFVLMTAMVSISQFFGNGRTPIEIVSLLQGSILVLILLLLLMFSLIAGIAAWHEKNKRYNRIYYSLKNNK